MQYGDEFSYRVSVPKMYPPVAVAAGGYQTKRKGSKIVRRDFLHAYCQQEDLSDAVDQIIVTFLEILIQRRLQGFTALFQIVQLFPFGQAQVPFAQRVFFNPGDGILRGCIDCSGMGDETVRRFWQR